MPSFSLPFLSLLLSVLCLPFHQDSTLAVSSYCVPGETEVLKAVLRTTGCGLLVYLQHLSAQEKPMPTQIFWNGEEVTS